MILLVPWRAPPLPRSPSSSYLSVAIIHHTAHRLHLFTPFTHSAHLSHSLTPPLTHSTHRLHASADHCRYGNIIIGPTAEPQKSRDDRSTDAATIAKLRAYGEKILPALRDERQATVIGTYVSVYLKCSLNDIPNW